MSVIGTPASQAGGLASIGSASGLFVKKSGGAGATAVTGAVMGGFNPAVTVKLSDHAKAMLAKAEQERTVANQLAAHLMGGTSTGFARDAAAATQATDQGLAQTSLLAFGKNADAINAVKEWAKSDDFRNAAKAVTDDQVRSLVRDGKLPTLPHLSDDEYNQMSEAEQNVYTTVESLQASYDSMPKTLDQALAEHKKSILESYPESISQPGLFSSRISRRGCTKSGYFRDVHGVKTSLPNARRV